MHFSQAKARVTCCQITWFNFRVRHSSKLNKWTFCL